MPNRYVREGINSSRRVASLDYASEVFYRRMINVVDDFGRFELDAKLIRSSAYPVHDAIREADILRWFAACETAELIVAYEIHGKKFLVLTNTEQPRAKHSHYPNPPEELVKRYHLFTCANTRYQVKTFAPSPNPNPNPNPKPEPSPNPESSIPDFDSAFAQTASAAIPKDFCRYVYDDWFSRDGKDAGGSIVKWLPYVTKRWAREQNEWKNGTHKGKRNENNNRTTAKGNDRNAGTYNANTPNDALKSKVR